MTAPSVLRTFPVSFDVEQEREVKKIRTGVNVDAGQRRQSCSCCLAQWYQPISARVLNGGVFAAVHGVPCPPAIGAKLQPDSITLFSTL